MHNDEIERLIDVYLDLSVSPENARRLQHWQLEICARDQWHGRPRPELFRKQGVAPVTVDVQNTFFARSEPSDLAQCYLDPAAYLRFFLRKRIFAFRNIPDDTPLDGVLPIYLSTPFETSLFGMPYHLFADRDPMIDQAHRVIGSARNLDELPTVDFRQSGMMPLAHRLFEEVGALVGGRLTVVFPEWLRGPLGVALYLRGYQDFLIDLVTDPEFAQALLARINTARMDWFRARAAYLGEPVGGGSLFNDEVDAGVIGARHYRAHVLPHEQALASFHGAITYWHSCGNTAPMAPDITRLAPLLLDVSGFTDLGQALLKIDAGSQVLEVRFNPVKDIEEASLAQMAACIRQKVALCRRYDVPAFTLRASGIQPWQSPAEDLQRLRQWIELARGEVERQPAALASASEAMRP